MSKSENIKATLKQKRLRGEFCGGRVPYGYMLTLRFPDKTRRLIPFAAEQEVIKTVQDLRKLDLTYLHISEALNRLGMRSRAGTTFQLTQISRILKKPPVLG